MQSEDKINAKKESENIVSSFDKNEKNPGSLEKVVSNNVEKQKSPGNRESFVPSFDKEERNQSSQEDYEGCSKNKVTLWFSQKILIY